MSKTRIVIVGGSFGGLTAAHRLRRTLPKRSTHITVISRDERFVFIPSLPWVTIGLRTLDQISFPLRPSLESAGIDFILGEVERIEPAYNKVLVNGEVVPYDFLVIATGHRSANEAVPGLGPYTGPGHSLMSASEAVEAGAAWQVYGAEQGPMVIGCAPGASCIGPAYEFLFEVDHILRRRRERHRAPITFVTPEPFLGHFGVGGMGRARQYLEGAFEERDVRYLTSASISRITDSSVDLSDGRTIESCYSMIMPPLAGVKAMTESPGLANPKGFVPTDDGFRHLEFDNVYAVGVAVAYPPVDETPVPVNFPKTGYMTVQMAKTAARNIVSEIQGGDRIEDPLDVQCILDMGDTAVRMVADPVRPPRNTSRMSESRLWLWAKKAYEPWFLWRMKTGRS